MNLGNQLTCHFDDVTNTFNITAIDHAMLKDRPIQIPLELLEKMNFEEAAKFIGERIILLNRKLHLIYQNDYL